MNESNDPRARVETSVQCLKCGYDLLGLDRAAVCPECAAPISDSVRGTLLRFADPAYLSRLHSGAVLVLTAIIVGLLSDVAGRLTSVAAPDLHISVSLAFGVVSFLAGVCGLVGWWRLSTLDPNYPGQDTGGAARRFVRIAVIVQAVALAMLPLPIAAVLLDLVRIDTDQRLATFGFVVLGLTVVSLGARLLQFLAAMVYLKWLGRRVPNTKIVKRAGTLMWVGPLLCTVGLLIVVGPLIALVLYYNLIDWLRKDLSDIRAQPAA